MLVQETDKYTADPDTERYAAGDSPAVAVQIKAVDVIAFKAELDKAIHLVQSICAVDPVPVSSKLS